jgi:uncharacterized protein (TIGR02646 family)
MRRLARGARPGALDGVKDGRTELKRAEEHFVTDERVDGFDFAAYALPEVKAALDAWTGRRCAYCEAYYGATQPQDTEHYRPKGRIETDAGRIQPGYWWLAADWDNLLPSCIDCNRIQWHRFADGSLHRSGKGELFPLADEAIRATAMGAEVHETPLLLDPCRDEPSEFLQFVEDGGFSIARPLDADTASLLARRARASIDIYGLNRPGLVNLRTTDLGRVKLSLRHVVRLARLLDAATPEEQAEIERDFDDEIRFLRRSATGENGFAGMSRPLIEPVFARLGLSLTE